MSLFASRFDTLARAGAAASLPCKFQPEPPDRWRGIRLIELLASSTTMPLVTPREGCGKTEGTAVRSASPIGRNVGGVPIFHQIASINRPSTFNSARGLGSHSRCPAFLRPRPFAGGHVYLCIFRRSVPDSSGAAGSGAAAFLFVRWQLGLMASDHRSSIRARSKAGGAPPPCGSRLFP